VPRTPRQRPERTSWPVSGQWRAATRASTPPGRGQGGRGFVSWILPRAIPVGGALLHARARRGTKELGRDRWPLEDRPVLAFVESGLGTPSHCIFALRQHRRFKTAFLKNRLVLAKNPKLWFTFQNVSNLMDPRRSDPAKTGWKSPNLGIWRLAVGKGLFRGRSEFGFRSAGLGNRSAGFGFCAAGWISIRPARRGRPCLGSGRGQSAKPDKVS
jgi:hypothetical protein